MYKDCNRRDNEDRRKDHPAISINFLGSFCLLVVIQDRRYQDLDQGKEHKQRADQKKGIEARHVRQTRQLAINGETVGNQCKHRCNRDADLRVGSVWIDPENGSRHHHDQHEGKNYFQDVMLDVTRGGEFKGITGILEAGRQRIRERFRLPFLNCPIRQCD